MFGLFWHLSPPLDKDHSLKRLSGETSLCLTRNNFSSLMSSFHGEKYTLGSFLLYWQPKAQLHVLWFKTVLPTENHHFSHTYHWHYQCHLPSHLLRGFIPFIIALHAYYTPKPLFGWLINVLNTLHLKNLKSPLEVLILKKMLELL